MSVSRGVGINLANGNLRLVGTSNVTFAGLGSTISNVYALGDDENLYTIDVATGQGVLIGPTGLSARGTAYGMSTNSASLYITVSSDFYKFSLKTGEAKLIGEMADLSFGAQVLEDNILYAASSSPYAIYAINRNDGAATHISDVTGLTSFPFGLAPIREKTINVKSLCKTHRLH